MLKGRLTLVELLGLLVVGIPTTVVVVLQGYWSYKCRFTGSLCEGSFVAPNISEATKDRVVAKLSSVEGQKSFDGLTIREAGYSFLSKRLDVLALFKDGTQTAIDTVPKEHGVQILAVEKYAIAAFLDHPRSGFGTRMVAYFPGPKIVKREFEFGSPDTNDSDIQVRNLSYDAKAKALTADIVSNDPWVEINGNANNKFEVRHSTSSTKFGATIVIELSPDYHINRAYDLASEREYEKSEIALQECKEKAKDERQTSKGELIACFQYQREDLTTQRSAVVIYEWDGFRYNEVTSNLCSFCYWSVDRFHKAVFVSEDHANETGKTGVNRWLSIYERPFDKERTLFISGVCKTFDMYEMSYVEDRVIRFQLTTDCASVKINNDQFNFRPEDQQGVETTGYYLLALDVNGLPVALAAVSTIVGGH